jgi:hypothetical protein
MFDFIYRIIRRVLAIKHVSLIGDRSRFIFAGSVNIRCGKGAKLLLTT